MPCGSPSLIITNVHFQYAEVRYCPGGKVDGPGCIYWPLIKGTVDVSLHLKERREGSRSRWVAGEAKAQRGWAVAQGHIAGQGEASAKSRPPCVPRE